MFLTRGLWILRDLARQVWARVALFSLLALVSAGIAPLIAPLLPEGLDAPMGRDPTIDLLSILTDSMLVVATFSLSVMVAAHHFAASQATPRSHRLLRGDGRTQSVLATFIGAFVFALTSRIAVNAGWYGERDFPVIYAVTIVVTVAVIVALIRWVQHLSSLGSIEMTTERVETVTRDALQAMADAPGLGCLPLEDDAQEIGRAVRADAFGYVRHVDIQSLSECAADGRIHILVQPGDWIGPGDVLMQVENVEASDEDLKENVVLGELRSFEQDPIFGLQVMAEIAQRALSPGLNDPQTAVDVIKRQASLLHLWTNGPVDDPIPGLRMRRPSPSQAVTVAFDPIARDGDGLVEVQLNIQQALARLAQHDVQGIRKAAEAVSQRALLRSDKALILQEDRDAVRDAAP